MPFNYEEYKNLDLKELKDKIRTIIIDYNDLEVKNKNLTTNNISKDEKLELLTKSNKDDIDQATNPLKEEIKQLKLKVAQYKKLAKDNKGSVNDNSKQLTQLQANYNNLLNQKQELENKLSELDIKAQESSRLATELKELKEEKNNLLNHNKQLNSTITKLEQQIKDLQSQLTQQSEITNDNSATIASLQQEIELLEEELEKVKAELTKWYEEFPEQTAEQVSEENIEYYRKQKAAESKRDWYEAEIERMKGEVDLHYGEYKKFLDVATQQKIMLDSIRKQLREQKLESKIEIPAFK